ncbi:MAG TPA: hypothetical protein G4N96_09950 [Chloroflexi bacterium]|nr:hypothetical protein [Chloroflexota bacterium]
MKPLKDALIDYDLPHLQSLAYKRGLDPPKVRNRETLKDFVEALLSPASIAIAVDALTEDEHGALEGLASAGGFMEARKFARLYGAIRAMGSSRLARDKPWESPANPAEALWYSGFIFKGFRHTLNGPEEVVFIPDNLLPLLPLAPAKQVNFQVNLSSAPSHVISSTLAAREDLFTLLVYLQKTFVRLSADDLVPEKHRQAMQAQFSGQWAVDSGQWAEGSDQPSVVGGQRSAIGGQQSEHWFEFILHLARRMDFLRKQGQRLKLNSEAVKIWLQKSLPEQAQQLQNIWRSDPTWNDLWHIPGLHPKATGWENSPLLARSKILGYLAQLPADEWISLKAFCKAIKRTEADFQRPGSDYQSWYIYDAGGKALMGVEHWDDVEGRLIEYLLSVTLFSLGVVDLGASAANLPPRVFKITPLGEAFFAPEAMPLPPSPAGASALRINPQNFLVRVPANASLYDRFQLARFARLLRREAEQVIYQIDRQSYRDALEQSINVEQVLAFLNRATRSQTPLALLESLRRWDQRSGAVKLEPLTALRVNQDDMLPELLEHPQIGPLLGPPLGPRAILVPEKNVAPLRKLLMELGYFGD